MVHLVYFIPYLDFPVEPLIPTHQPEVRLSSQRDRVTHPQTLLAGIDGTDDLDGHLLSLEVQPFVYIHGRRPADRVCPYALNLSGLEIQIREKLTGMYLKLVQVAR